MYKYLNPIENGYTKIKISKKDFNRILPKRKLKWYQKIDSYKNDKCYLFEVSNNFLYKIILTLLFPFAILLSLINIKETFGYYKNNVFKQKERGNFQEIRVCRDNIRYNEFEELLKN